MAAPVPVPVPGHRSCPHGSEDPEVKHRVAERRLPGLEHLALHQVIVYWAVECFASIAGVLPWHILGCSRVLFMPDGSTPSQQPQGAEDRTFRAAPCTSPINCPRSHTGRQLCHAACHDVAPQAHWHPVMDDRRRARAAQGLAGRAAWSVERLSASGRACVGVPAVAM